MGKLKYDYSKLLEEIKEHIRVHHGYEPDDWPGDEYGRRTVRINYLGWVDVHRREHREWHLYFNPDEEIIYSHNSKDIGINIKDLEAKKVLYYLSNKDEELEEE